MKIGEFTTLPHLIKLATLMPHLNTAKEFIARLQVELAHQMLTRRTKIDFYYFINNIRVVQNSQRKKKDEKKRPFRQFFWENLSAFLPIEELWRILHIVNWDFARRIFATNAAVSLEYQANKREINDSKMLGQKAPQRSLQKADFTQQKKVDSLHT